MINPGILSTVNFLRQNGFNTCDSGDGKTHDFECDYPVPYVHIQVDVESIDSECKRLEALLKENGAIIEDYSDGRPSITYCIIGNFGFISLWNVLIDSPIETSR